jgi:hypothetical protein
MALCPMPPFLIYKFDLEMECIDGQNRLTTIKEYQEQEPTDDYKPFAWIIAHHDETGELAKTEYVYFKETPAFAKYVQEMNKKNLKKGKAYRFMNETEKTRFNDYGLVAQMIKTKLTLDQRKAIFNKWQNGSSITQCDSLKNDNTPFCNWIVADGIERRLGAKISEYLKAGNKNWLFDVVRLLRVFLKENNPPSYSILSTLQARTATGKSTDFNKADYDAAVCKAEKFLDSVAPLKTLKKKMYISFLLSYAYLWYNTKDEQKRTAMEQPAFMIEFANKSLDTTTLNHSTLNNGPQLNQFMEKFDTIQQNLEIEISKQVVKPTPQPYKKATISTDLKQKLWEKYYGNQGVAKCFCCGADDIKPLSFEAGHVVAESAGGPTILDNMRPICKGCNRRMASTNMKDWMAQNYPKRTFA